MNWLRNLTQKKDRTTDGEKVVGVWKAEKSSKQTFTYYLIQPQNGTVLIDGLHFNNSSSNGESYEIGILTYSDVQWNGARLRATQKYQSTGFTIRLDLKLADNNKLEGISKEEASGYKSKVTWIREQDSQKAIDGLKEIIKRALYANDNSIKKTAAEAFKLLLNPEEEVALLANEQGLKFLSNRDFEQALQHFDRALSVFSDDGSILSNKGIALNELGRYDEAILYFDRAIALDPKGKGAPEDWNNKGNALLVLGRHTEALECYEKVIKAKGLRRTVIHSLQGKAEALGGLKKLPEAMQTLDVMLLLDASSQYALEKKIEYMAQAKSDENIREVAEEPQDTYHVRLKPLSSETVFQLQSQGAWMLDLRSWQIYKSGHLSNALTIPLDSPQFRSLMRMSIPNDGLVVLVVEEADIELAIRRIAEVGQFPLAGYLKGGMKAWRALGLPTDVEEDL